MLDLSGRRHGQPMLYFIPTYGGFPPALWFAFCQRYQDMAVHEPIEELRRGVLSILTIRSIKGSPGGGFTEMILRQHAGVNPRKLICFESINTDSSNLNSLKDKLIENEEIQRRLRRFADRTTEGM